MVEAVQSPRQVAVGVALQFSVMPLLAFTISRLLPLPTPLAVGLILVGCCPGGTASNLVTCVPGYAKRACLHADASTLFVTLLQVYCKG